jgi:hypothetical protein
MPPTVCYTVGEDIRGTDVGEHHVTAARLTTARMSHDGRRESRAVRRQKRQRRTVSGLWIAVLKPLFRYSIVREAYVLRIGGRHFGPVLTRRPAR